MGFLEDLKGLSGFAIASAILTTGAFLFQTIGLALPNWHSAGSFNNGLWRYCVGGVCKVIDDVAMANLFSNAGAFKAAQACETIALLAILAADVVIILQYFVIKNMKMCYIIRNALLPAAFFLIPLGMVMYVFTSKTTDFGSALYFCLTAVIIIVAEGGVSYYEKKRNANITS